MAWDDAESALPSLWQAVIRVRTVEDHRLRRFFQFYFYPVAVDRFSMLFMSADGLLFPYPEVTQSGKVEFARRGAKLLRAAGVAASEAELAAELTKYYQKRNGEFHGTARLSGAEVQRGAERLEHYVRLLIRHFLKSDLLGSMACAEEHIRCTCEGSPM